MTTLTVRSGAETLRLSVARGASVREALDTTALRVRAACGGTGACGACTVRLVGGAATPPTVAEHLKLTPAERAAGVRLACQLRLTGDAEVALDDPAPPSPWHSLPPDDLGVFGPVAPTADPHFYGVAVDLGTTQIRLALWDRKRGRRLATRVGPNPQAAFGADVLNRLDAARRDPERARRLAELARAAIVAAIRDILARDFGEVHAMLAEIGRVQIVGNSVMGALLTGVGLDALADPARWGTTIAVQPDGPASGRDGWHMPHAEILVTPTVAGFVGSDLSADVLATGLATGAPGALLFDLGTNTELALWDGARLHVTSVPGGPAFESGGIRHGRPAEAGAIARVRPGPGGGFVCDVLGGGPARGLCGSGLVDAIALLLERGQLKPSGRFTVAPGEAGIALIPGNPRSALAASDVDAFQRAKAATAAAALALLDAAAMTWADVTRVCVCGAFGRHLDVGHAQRVGLLPQLPVERFACYPEAALTGCERALLAPAGEDPFAAWSGSGRDRDRDPIKALNLALVPGYEDRFIGELRLRPLGPPG